MNEFGKTLQDLIESRGLQGYADLNILLEKRGYDVPEGKISAFMEGNEWVEGRFSLWVAEVLNLDVEEMGTLAHAVAYGQTKYPL